MMITICTKVATTRLMVLGGVGLMVTRAMQREARRGNNSDLSFIKRKEISVGLRGSLWNKMLTFDASFFKNSLEGMLVQPSNSYPNYFVSYWPESTLLPYVNYNNSTVQVLI